MGTLHKRLEELTPILRDVVVVYIINRETNEVILGERKKPDRPGMGKRVGIGGGIEAGETPLQAAEREVIEEIGTNSEGNVVFKLNSAEHAGTVYFLFPHKKDNSGYNQRCFVFISDDYTGSPVETKDIKPESYLFNSLPKEYMWPDNLLWVPKVLGGETINGIFLYDEKNSIADYQIETKE